MSWRNCKCALFDNNRLFARAEQIVDRDGPRVGGEARDAEIREVARAVETNHAVEEISDAKAAEKSKTSTSMNAQHVASENVTGVKTNGLLGSGNSPSSI